MHLDSRIFAELTKSGKRIPWLSDWLLTEVWSKKSWDSLPPDEYLKKGELLVNGLEQIISSSAPAVYDEIVGESKAKSVAQFLKYPGNAVVIFDGLSIREAPILYDLCEKSGFTVREVKTSISAIPSETLDFVDQVLDIGRISPSQLPNRRELKERDVKAYYYDSPAQRHRIEGGDKSLLLWSSFPDNTYNDSGARFIKHFENNRLLLEEAWKSTLLQIPPGKKILVTSDHGYIFFGPGCSFTRSNEETRRLTEYFGGDRFKYVGESEKPLQHPDIYTTEDGKICLIKGRVQTHPPGQASTKLYKHGGLSVMECIVPWIVLERKDVS